MGANAISDKPLVCPKCATSYGLDEQFCVKCGLPLNYAVQEQSGSLSYNEARTQAQKIKPEFAEGELVKVGWGRNQAEAEMIQLMLLEEGIPTTLRRSAGFDVPDFLAAGPRDVLAPRSGAEFAREILCEAELAPSQDELERNTNKAGYLLMFVFVTILAVIGLIWALVEATK